MNFENFTYPAYGTPLVEAYDRRFESVFIILHPFLSVPDFLSWRTVGRYPDDSLILTHATRHSWIHVVRETGLGTCARLNHALLTSIGSLKGDLSDPAGQNVLKAYLQSHPIWMPTEGRFEPILQEPFLDLFGAAKHDELIFVPEFTDSLPVVRLPIPELRDGSIPFPGCGTLVAPDGSFLLTVDWDSFFTLFYGSRSFLLETARQFDLEGFFATSNTDHAWFNYSMGCATVTLSPEDWQQMPA